MPEYGKKTVAELQEILKSRSLPHTGKKADLVARLNEADQTAESTAEPAPEVVSTKQPSKAPSTVESATAKEASPPTSAKTAMATSDETSTATAPASAVPAQLQEQREDSVATDVKLADAASYKLGLEQSSVDEEAKKREARAKKFGIQPETENDEEAKKAARAKKFGTSADSDGLVARLDSALPDHRRGKRGRDGETTGATDDPGLRAGRGGKRRQRGGGRQEGRPTGVQKTGGKTSGAFPKHKDRLAAEARKKRFATA